MKFHDLLQIILDRELQKSNYELLAPVVIPEFNGMVFVTKSGQIFKGSREQIRYHLLDNIATNTLVRYKKTPVQAEVTDCPENPENTFVFKQHLLLGTNLLSRVEGALQYWTSCFELTNPTDHNTHTPCMFTHYNI